VGWVTVKGVAPGGPAALDGGVLPGSRVVAVDGRSVEGLDLAAVVALVVGPEGSDVVLKLQRPPCRLPRGEAAAAAEHAFRPAPAPAPAPPRAQRKLACRARGAQVTHWARARRSRFSADAAAASAGRSLYLVCLRRRAAR
jgi:hypothetical protein